ncbi:MAG: 30S ribosomal protein S3 [Bacilli bacterium]
MGQKVSPHGFRVGINKNWSSQWFADKKSFAQNLLEDNKIRNLIKEKYYTSGISSIIIERTDSRVVINIKTARPGVLIGQRGAGIENLKKQLSKIVDMKNLVINIKEVKQIDLDAQLIAEGIALQVEKRVTFKRALKEALPRVMKAGAQGCKVMISGRLNGAEIARSAYYQEGSLPLQTIRADIDYGYARANTTYGVLGVKTWIYKGEILGKRNSEDKGGNN